MSETVIHLGAAGESDVPVNPEDKQNPIQSDNEPNGVAITGCGESPDLEKKTIIVSVAKFAKSKRLDHTFLGKVICVAIFAYFGVLVRVLLTALSNLHPNLSALGSGFLLANIVGCFIMGLMVKLGPRFVNWPILATGITTGFCGSCTTFATWQAKVVKRFSEKEWVPSLIQIVVTLGLSQIGFIAGSHFGNFVEFIIAKIIERKGQPNAEEHRRHQKLVPDNPKLVFLIVTLLIFALLFWVLAFTDPNYDHRLWWIAVCFGPLGALIRYWLSLYNPRVPSFPWFTFIANVAASVINIILYIGAVHVRQDNGVDSPNAACYTFWALNGISTGAMGSLSTVSTWINELNKLASKNLWLSYRYGLATFIFAQLLCWFIVGIWMGVGNDF